MKNLTGEIPISLIIRIFMAEQQNQPLLGEDEINLLDYWRVIWKRKILIGIICLTTVLVVMVYSLRLPKIYKSVATILPSQGGGGGGGGIMSNPAVSNLAPFLGISAPTTNRDIILSILKSRLIVEKIVDHFNLKDYYKSPYLDKAINSLKGATKILPSKDGIITIEVEDKDPKMAADIANAYIEHLNRLNSQFGIGTAGRQRRFIADQLAREEKNLRKAEDILKEFQEKYCAVSIPEQARETFEAATKIKAEIVAAEVQLQVMQNYTKEAHPEAIKLKRKIDELKRQLAQSQYSTGLDLPPATGAAGHFRKEIYLPAVNVPQIGLELARLTRNVKVREAVYTMLTQELEKAKIDEVRDMPVVQPLDRAVPPHSKYKPNIRQNMTLALVVSLFLGIFIAFGLEYIDKQKSKNNSIAFH